MATGYLGFKKSTVDGLTPLKRKMLRSVMRDTALSPTPSTWQKGATIAYFFGDTRWDEDGMALLGSFGANLAWVNVAVMRADFDDEHGHVLRAFIFGLLAGGGKLILPENIPAVLPNRMQEILTAEGLPTTQCVFYTDGPSENGWTQVG